MRGIWVWGKSGSGKDYYINKILEGQSVYKKTDKTKWFSNYSGEKVLYWPQVER